MQKRALLERVSPLTAVQNRALLKTEFFFNSCAKQSLTEDRVSPLTAVQNRALLKTEFLFNSCAKQNLIQDRVSPLTAVQNRASKTEPKRPAVET